MTRDGMTRPVLIGVGVVVVAGLVVASPLLGSLLGPQCTGTMAFITDMQAGDTEAAAEHHVLTQRETLFSKARIIEFVSALSQVDYTAMEDPQCVCDSAVANRTVMDRYRSEYATLFDGGLLGNASAIRQVAVRYRSGNGTVHRSAVEVVTDDGRYTTGLLSPLTADGELTTAGERFVADTGCSLP